MGELGEPSCHWLTRTCA